jgi:hypothetical protein
MKKDVIFSMRMSSEVRDALRKAAKREHRTSSSLLNKVAVEYLEREGFPAQGHLLAERRQHERKKVILPSRTYLDSQSREVDIPGVILDISAGGVLVTYPRTSEIRSTSIAQLSDFELCFELPDTREGVCFDCSAKRMNNTGNEIRVAATFKNPGHSSIENLRGSLQ